MTQVAIGSQAYTVYASVGMADLYLEAGTHADTWRAATADVKARALVTSRRIIDRQLWKGEKYDEDQELEFPRKNMGLADIADDEVPTEVIDASIELALALVDGSDVQNQQSTAARIRSISAGSVSLSFFRGVDQFNLRFPLIVYELLRRFLSGAGGVSRVSATGVDCETSFKRNQFGYSSGIS